MHYVYKAIDIHIIFISNCSKLGFNVRTIAMNSADLTGKQPYHIVVWFKRDLRVVDHEPLFRAFQKYRSLQKNQQPCLITPLYIIEPELKSQTDYSHKHWHCILDCLHDLHVDLQKLGSKLIIRTGNAVDVMQSLEPTVILATEETGNDWTFKRDLGVHRLCKESGIQFIEYPNSGIIRRLASRDDWNKLHKQRFEREAFLTPIQLPPCNLASEKLPLREVSNRQNRTGRVAAVQDLCSFVEYRSSKYRYSLSRPWYAQTYNSRLSMHIAYGALSVYEIFEALKTVSHDSHKQGIQAMRSRLYWRDHFIQKLESQPSIEFECMHPMMEGMRNVNNQRYLEEWYLGKTGYPLVDASMRCLHQTGWLNFRMRAMVVSFAAYHLWLDWRVIHPYLAQLFADYEPGIHFSQLQMQSGVTGINAIRMYNPLKQSYEKDEQGQFIKQYVPELSHLSAEEIHEPWQFSDYKKPIVDLKEATSFARKNLSEFRNQPAFKSLSQSVFKSLGSRKKQSSRRTTKTKKDRSAISSQLSLFEE